MVRHPATEASIESVTKKLREFAYSGHRGNVTVHFDGRRFTKVELNRVEIIEESSVIPSGN